MNPNNMNQNNMNPVMPNVAPVMPNNPVAADEKPSKSSSVLSILSVIVACIIAAIAIFIATQKQMSYQALRNDIDVQIDRRVADAKEEQKQIDRTNQDKKTAEKYKTFTGPSDMGTINFYYPKNWHLYIDDNGASGSSYAAYFDDEPVKPVGSKDSKYALIFSVVNQDVDSLAKTYDAMSSKGLSGQIFTVSNNITGKRYDGVVTEGGDQISFVIFGIGSSGKTAIFQTTSLEHKTDFEYIIRTITRVSK